MSERKWRKERATLLKLVEAEGLSVVKSRYIDNGYNSPMKFYGRRNEVWLIKDDSEL